MTKAVQVYMNLAYPQVITKYKDLPFDGIGLLRMESVIASSVRTHPVSMLANGLQQAYVESLQQAIELVVAAVHPKPVVVRLSDFTSDVSVHLAGGATVEAKESLPLLGLRGVSRHLSVPFLEACHAEYAAIRAVQQNYNNVWIMLPFVRTVQEVEQCLYNLSREGLERSDCLKIWVMAEVPSVALLIDEFAKLPIDGFSIGSNDLTQLTLGVSRDNERLAKLGYFDERHPSVMKAMRMVVEGAGRAGLTCSACGDSVSTFPELVQALVDWGIDSVSVIPDSLVRTRMLIETMNTRQ